jgi:hypothetical protein
MASPVEISNVALGNLGAENLVSSIDPPDGSVEAGYCATFYPLARTRMLEAAKPHFAQRRQALVLNATNASRVWAYSYALPSDCLKPLRVLEAVGSSLFLEPGYQGPLSPAQGHELSTAPFALEDGVLYTDEADATLVYVYDQVDTTKWTPLFTEAVEGMLTSYLAGPILKGTDGARLGVNWRQMAYQMALSAAASAANASGETADYIPESVRARA